MSVKRRFSLPNIEELTKQQEKVRALPSQGQHLIVGGPGTGKSVVALFRVKKLKNEQRDYACLAFNHLLLSANEQLVVEEICNCQWQSWFTTLYKSTLGASRVPRLSPNRSGFRHFDWQAILTAIGAYAQQESKADFSGRFLVIDEGQDMPQGFYQALIELGFENFFIVADQNQQIVQHQHSSIMALTNSMGLHRFEVHELTDNFRNGYGIACFCEHFYTDPASPKPELPPPTYNNQKPVLYGYEPVEFGRVIDRILTQATNAPSKLIGVLCANNTTLKRYYGALLAQKSNHANSTVPISFYNYDNKNPIAFDQGGIVVINGQSCKGLEFDTVFLADVNEHQVHHGNVDGLKKLFYVMSSRARERLILLVNKAEEYGHLSTILPNEEQILQKYHIEFGA